jgi:DNA polymerase elongation subunit (family B)
MKTQKNKSKILVYDIETSYTVGAVWGLYDQTVAAVLREPYIISFAWKWLGEKDTHVKAISDFKNHKKDRHCDFELIKELWKLFDEADIIIAHNGNAFDQKWVYGRFAVWGIKPPSPSKYIDTLLVSKAKFRFNSNRLNDLGKYFEIGQKADTGGIQLWIDCVELDKKEAWDKMKEYNKKDVILLEKVYKKILPYITNHPNVALINGDLQACPNCGSSNIQKRGFAMSRLSRFQRWACVDCGSWHQSLLDDEESQVR